MTTEAPGSGPPMTSLPAAARKRSEIKLYVWEDAFGDYYPGIAFALARTAQEAREVIARTYVNYDSAMRELADKPAVIRIHDTMRPRGWQQSGGG